LIKLNIFRFVLVTFFVVNSILIHFYIL